LVDAYLACRKIMPKWQGLDDMESIFGNLSAQS
jgi:hypothetical protein